MNNNDLTQAANCFKSILDILKVENLIEQEHLQAIESQATKGLQHVEHCQYVLTAMTQIEPKPTILAAMDDGTPIKVEISTEELNRIIKVRGKNQF